MGKSIGGKFEKVSIEDTLSQLSTNPETGLSSDEATKRLQQ